MIADAAAQVSFINNQVPTYVRLCERHSMHIFQRIKSVTYNNPLDGEFVFKYFKVGLVEFREIPVCADRSSIYVQGRSRCSIHLLL